MKHEQNNLSESSEIPAEPAPAPKKILNNIISIEPFGEKIEYEPDSKTNQINEQKYPDGFKIKFSSDSFKIVVFGDAHPGPEFDLLSQTISNRAYDFILYLGDIYKNGVASIDDPKFYEYFYNAFNDLIFTVIGNHERSQFFENVCKHLYFAYKPDFKSGRFLIDHTSDLDDKLTNHPKVQLADENASLFNQLAAAGSHYVLECNNEASEIICVFIVLDTNRLPADLYQQAWLQRIYDNYKNVDNIFMVGHHNPIPTGKNSEHTWKDDLVYEKPTHPPQPKPGKTDFDQSQHADVRRTLKHILGKENYKKLKFLGGHEHNLSFIKKEKSFTKKEKYSNPPQFTSGAIGPDHELQDIYNPKLDIENDIKFTARESGYIALEINSHQTLITFTKLNGEKFATFKLKNNGELEKITPNNSWVEANLSKLSKLQKDIWNLNSKSELKHAKQAVKLATFFQSSFTKEGYEIISRISAPSDQQIHNGTRNLFLYLDQNDQNTLIFATYSHSTQQIERTAIQKGNNPHQLQNSEYDAILNTIKNGALLSEDQQRAIFKITSPLGFEWKKNIDYDNKIKASSVFNESPKVGSLFEDFKLFKSANPSQASEQKKVDRCSSSPAIFHTKKQVSDSRNRRNSLSDCGEQIRKSGEFIRSILPGR